MYLVECKMAHYRLLNNDERSTQDILEYKLVDKRSTPFKAFYHTFENSMPLFCYTCLIGS